MSGIAGIFHRDGRHAELDSLERMVDAAPHRGRDGVRTIGLGSVALAHQRLAATVQSAAETQPLMGARGCVLVFDGRIDAVDGAPVRFCTGGSQTDAGVVLSAWQRWGDGCLSRLAGDFAFALWDPEARRLFCARDPLGIQPLYYADCGSLVLFASEPSQLLAHPAVDGAPDEGYVAELLAGTVRSHAATLYRGIRRVPPGHALVADHQSIGVHRYWDLDLSHELRYRSDDDYAAHFKAVFEEAVRCRLRSIRPVASYLSGGLDSSSIVVVAADLARRGLGPAIDAVSLVFPGQPDADESLFIKDVIRSADVNWIRIESGPYDVRAAVAAAERRRDMPDFPNDAADHVRRALVARNVGVTLSGTGGDLGLSGSFFHYADLLRRGRFVRLARRYVDVVRSPGMRWRSAMFLRGGVWPILPPAVKRAVRWGRRRVRGEPLPSWIPTDFARRTALADRLRREPTPDRLPSAARYDVRQAYRDPWSVVINEMYERASVESGLEDRHPFLDVRLVEFVAALPDDQRWKDGRTKYVLRQAMKGLLPESVRTRPDKAEFSGLFVDALSAIGGESFFADLDIARLGWVDGKEVVGRHRRMLARLAAGDPYYGDDAWVLWMIAGIETWRRSMEKTIRGAEGQAA
jgi:asparagine synthase (glutamine-hydrolysing)